MIRAWHHGSGERPLPLVSCELPEPELADDQILVAVEGSVFGAPERVPAPGITPGGAAVGTIAAAGQSAAELRGKRVVIGPDMGCGECDVCRRAAVVACPRGSTLGRTVHGTLASAVVARARWACVLDHGLDIPGPAAALVGRELAWAYAMFVRAGVAPGEPVIVLGQGIVARFLVEIAVAKGTRPLVAVPDDGRPEWSAWIHSRGGTAVECNPASARERLRAAAKEGGHGERPWYLFETSGARQQRGLALALCGAGARLTMLARRALGHTSPGEALAIDVALDADASVLGVAGAHPDLLPELAALVVRGEVDLASAAEVVPPEALADVVARNDAARGVPRALVVTPGT